MRFLFYKKKLSRHNITTLRKNLIENPKSFKLRPDIFLEGKFIADTKWKIIGSSNDISQANLCQLYAYGKKHECCKLHLIYPKIDGAKQEPMNFKYENNMWLEILYFDLENDKFFTQSGITNELR